MIVNAQQSAKSPDNALSDTERCELAAYNAAFEQLGFAWRWSDEDYRALLNLPDATARVAHYITEHHPHLLSAYDPGALASLIQEIKRGCESGASVRDDRLQSFDPEFRPL